MTKYYVELNGKYVHRVYQRKSAALKYAKELAARKRKGADSINLWDSEGNLEPIL